MPEYLAPGVYVEETSYRSKSIEGVGTSTTAFVGPTLKGPAGITPGLITTFAEFERVYGGFGDINGQPNYIAHAVNAFFDNGGSRLYVSRVQPSNAQTSQSDDLLPDEVVDVRFRARFPGEGGNGVIELSEKATQISQNTLASAPIGSVLRLGCERLARPAQVVGSLVVNNGSRGWRDQSDTQIDLSQQSFAAASILTLNVISRTNDGVATIYEDLGYSPDHPRWIGSVLASTPTRWSDGLSNPVVLSVGGGSINPLRLRNRLAELATELVTRNEPIRLRGGSSGGDPLVGDYRAALESLQSLEDISIVAAPGYSAYGATLYLGIEQELLTFVARRRSYQIAILDTPKQQNSKDSFNDARTARSRIDSSYAALYYPWVVVANPLFLPGKASQPAEIALPPSGFICGIYGRNDAQRGVFKTPANEIVVGALRFERDINSAELEILNSLGVNCLRFSPGRGYRVWGGRTTSSDPEFKDVSVRRFLNYLEASIDRSTQWAVFEPNGERLWANIRDTVTHFLYNEWVSGALLGDSVQDAFFVRCDRTTMTQNDLDNGRLIVLIGVAVIKPAEFVVFRIGQKTVDGLA
jgi:phage tail sheath protein FI